LKGLTLTQPWASLVAAGEKRVETRSWSTPYRGRLAIHAAKGLADPVFDPAGLAEIFATDPFHTALRRSGFRDPAELPRGAVLATCDLIACVATSQLKRALDELPELASWRPGEFERAFGNYDAGRYCFLLTDVRGFDEPIDFRGKQGLFDVPDDVLGQVGFPIVGPGA
jgi:hypothetical protein